MKKSLHILILVVAALALSGWGSKGHRKISQNMAPGLPSQMAFLQPDWTNYVASHSSDADYRKEMDPNESPRHYIDIDNYPQFLQTGRIPQTFDSVVAKYGYSFVINQGTLPWATLTTFDSLRSCFQRRDWNRSAYFAADLAHYVGDGHMPLHITANYNGQMTGQSGVHSRYETSMISRYESSIVYDPGPASYLSGNVGDYIFTYLYGNYRYVDSILIADNNATSLTGSTNSDAYYQKLWEGTGAFTTGMMKNASGALATLIYTAWVRAGSPVFTPNAIGEDPYGPALSLDVFPNPVSGPVTFSITVNNHADPVTVVVYDHTGKPLDTLLNRPVDPKTHDLCFDTGGYAPGIYVVRLTCGSRSVARRFVVIP